MLFRETVAVYCENHSEYTNTQCGQNAEFYCVNVRFKGLTSQKACMKLIPLEPFMVTSGFQDTVTDFLKASLGTLPPTLCNNSGYVILADV
jgi:hypothetical protein